MKNQLPKTAEKHTMRNVFFVFLLFNLVLFVGGAYQAQVEEKKEQSLFSQIKSYGLKEDFDCKRNAKDAIEKNKCSELFDAIFWRNVNKIMAESEDLSVEEQNQLSDEFESKLQVMYDSGGMKLPLNEEEKALFLDMMEEIYEVFMPREMDYQARLNQRATQEAAMKALIIKKEEDGYETFEEDMGALREEIDADLFVDKEIAFAKQIEELEESHVKGMTQEALKIWNGKFEKKIEALKRFGILKEPYDKKERMLYLKTLEDLIERDEEEKTANVNILEKVIEEAL
jgi:hypothetical protein